MNFLRLLAKVEIRAVAAVLAVGAAISLYAYVTALISPGSMLPASDWPKITFLYVAILGIPAAALVGAPAYAILKAKSLASWPAVIVLGLLPGAAIMLAIRGGDDLGLWFIGCGVAVACLTHLMSKALGPSIPHESTTNAL